MHSQQGTQHGDTKHINCSQQSKHCIKNSASGGNVRFCPKETQKIRTNIYGLQSYKPVFHATSTGSL